MLHCALGGGMEMVEDDGNDDNSGAEGRDQHTLDIIPAQDDANCAWLYHKYEHTNSGISN